MVNTVRRRDLLKLGTLTTASGVLMPWVSPPRVTAGATVSVFRGETEGALTADRALEALKEAVRWPRPSLQTVLSLTSQFIAARRDQEGYRYFHERGEAAPDEPVFRALEGLFQARMAGQVFLLRRVASDPGTQVIAQTWFADELRIVNETGVPFRYFFGGEARRHYDVVPDRLVGARETLTVGGTEFVFFPVHGGETADALLIHLPATGVLFVGDVFMPYLGAPFLPEGSAEGLFETMALIRSLNPRILVHGHPPLSDLFTMESLAGFEAALRELYARTLERIRDGRILAEMLHQNWLPASLRTNPSAVLPFLIIRDNFIQRVVHQRTGYWKPDGEGIEVLSPREWAGALNLLAGGQDAAFVRSARTLLEQGDEVLALKLLDLGLLNYPANRVLADLRHHALDGLRTRYQNLNPFKFIVYSEWAGADLASVD